MVSKGEAKRLRHVGFHMAIGAVGALLVLVTGYVGIIIGAVIILNQVSN